MSPEEAQRTLERRLAPRALGLIDIVSELRHFALITYAVPKERLAPHIPERFEITEFWIDGERRALLSVVPFLDADFHFQSVPWARCRFAQTNHRVYVTDRSTGEPAVWFFGTTLGSHVVHLARWIWRIPWHHARYVVDCDYDAERSRYRSFRYRIDSSWCSGRIDLEDTGQPMRLSDGFTSIEHMTLVLTHPIEGFFRRTDGRVGTYSVSHDVIPSTVAQPKDLYFALYERLGIMTPADMQHPHSVLVSPRTVFSIHMPPRAIS